MNTVSLPVAATTPPPAGAATRPALTPRLATGLAGMLLASLLAILNEQVTAAAMADIRGAFSIGHDDGSWLTALFEAANVATMVFAPWFGITFTLKRFTIGAVLATLLLGVLCPFAPGFATLTALRVLQGIAGGCLPPMLIIAALRYLPPRTKLYGLAGYAMTATFGPALGTPLAALWTEFVDWRLAFWQIVPLGIACCAAIGYGLPADTPKPERLRAFNWSGFLTGFPAVAMLVVVLLQADRLDGFESPAIRMLTGGGLVLLAAFLVNEWFHPLPFFRLQLLARRNFTHGLLTLAGAVILLTAVTAIPGRYLAAVHGYRPLQAAPLALLVALPLLLSLPLTAALLNLRRVDSRWVLATGCVLMAATCAAGSRLTAEWIRDDFYWLQSLQIAAQPMLILPILMGVTTGLPPAEGPFASAMFNSLKTFSAALAAGLLDTLGTAREHLHSNRLVDQLGNRAPSGGGDLLERATGLAPLAHRLHEQALVLASADLYRLAAGVALALLLLVPLLPVRIAPPWAPQPPSSH
ncbi:DSBA oxidoreductase [Burkholderia sp. MSh2]|uniref:MFS transporter n=1 Tax=Burkholderia paludis TaxID=1506587 RepID=A0A6P2S958_9BURK|nr:MULTISPECIES: MFS transporter [Burkholderia]KEZ02718.1 DSBA oxidoreductase [Burkholderia sp. MSh2]CAB3770248.1 putative multidrug resistance protein EmrY [Burkholderia paludis]VWC46638.1 MFS transporter [Burkholderia paludis]